MPARERVQLIYNDAISGTDIQLSPVIPAGQKWQVGRIIFADKNIGDNISGGFQIDWGSSGAWEVVFAGYLTGATHCIEIKQIFEGDGTKRLRMIRQNNSPTAKEMFLMVEGNKRIGDLP
jgi:hypothetical protein